MKLTKAIRQNMQSAILTKKFSPKIEKIRKRLSTIAQQTADNFYPKKIKDWIDAAPMGGLHSTTQIFLADGEDIFDHIVFSPNAKNSWSKYYVALTKPIKVLANDQYQEEFQVSAKNAKALKAITKELDAIAKDREATSEVLASALWACNTRKQLAEQYPELVSYLPKIEKQTKALAVTSDAVKKILP
jgi:hypothetical protein